MTRVLLAGAGHAGLAFLHALLGRMREVEVVLFEPRDTHLLKPRLLESLADPEFPVELPLAPLVTSKRVEWVRKAAGKVGDGEARAGGKTWRGDFVVIAAGARTRFPQPAARGRASVGRGKFVIDRVEDVRALDAHLSSCVQAASRAPRAKRRALLSALVVGGGYTGVEAAAEIAVLLRRRATDAGLSAADVHVLLAEARDRLGAGGVPDEEMSRRADESLASKGVDVRLGQEVRFDRGAPQLGRRRLDVATVLLATGIESALGNGERATVDACFRLRGATRTLAIGDAARVPGAVASAQHAVQEGRHAARVIEVLALGHTPPPFRPSTLGEFVTLGQGDCIGWLSVAGRRVHLRGLPAAAARTAAFARYLAGLKLGARAL